jgi:hypothetical protein
LVIDICSVLSIAPPSENAPDATLLANRVPSTMRLEPELVEIAPP